MLVSRLSLLLVAFGLLATPAMAQPDPAFSSVPHAITILPDFSVWPGTEINNITVAGAGGTPIAFASMEIVLNPIAEDLLTWCGGAANGLTGDADANGLWEPVLLGGGCFLGDDPNLATPIVPAQIFADGVLIGNCDINSPDALNADGRRVTDPLFTPDTNLAGEDIAAFWLGDLVYHTAAVINQLPQRCSFFNPNLDPSTGVSLYSAVVVTAYMFLEPPYCVVE